MTLNMEMSNFNRKLSWTTYKNIITPVFFLQIEFAKYSLFKIGEV